MQIPDSCFISNNNSALHEDEFARRAIEDLLTKRCILEVDSPLYCCNPLTVVRGKKLLLVIEVMQIQVRKFSHLVGDV